MLACPPAVNASFPYLLCGRGVYTLNLFIAHICFYQNPLTEEQARSVTKFWKSQKGKVC